MKIFNNFKKNRQNAFIILPSFVRKKVCTHPDRRKVKLHDGIWDRMTDNDDLEDSDTIIEVEYCPDCGRILGIKRCSYKDRESFWQDIYEFEEKTGIRASTVTLWKERKLSDFKNVKS